MLLILIDAVTLVVLLQVVNNEDIGLLMAAVIAFVAAIGTTLLAFALASVLGIVGVLLAAAIGAAGVGVAVSALYGVEIKRALMIGGIFVVVHIGASFLLQMMMS